MPRRCAGRFRRWAWSSRPVRAASAVDTRASSMLRRPCGVGHQIHAPRQPHGRSVWLLAEFLRSSSVISSSVRVFAVLFLGFHCVEQGIEPPEIAFPDFSVLFEPLAGFCERLGLDAAGTALGVAATGNESGALKNSEVFGDGGLAHGEGLGEFVDG